MLDVSCGADDECAVMKIMTYENNGNDEDDKWKVYFQRRWICYNIPIDRNTFIEKGFDSKLHFIQYEKNEKTGSGCKIKRKLE